jgi:septal ring factor EnvC (AmiA/AmiB activator)
MKITIDIGELEGAVLKQVKQLLTEFKQEIIMSNEKVELALSKLDENTTKLSEVVASVVAADQAEDDAFRAKIAELEQQIADGKAVTAAQLEALANSITSRGDKLTEVADALKAIGVNPAEPVPPVVIEPVEPVV